MAELCLRAAGALSTTSYQRFILEIPPMNTERSSFIGGSDARIIMGNDEARLIRLWREKRGEAEPENLSQDLIVQLGSITEELNRTWYERSSGHAVEDVQRRVRHPIHKWMCATLDG